MYPHRAYDKGPLYDPFQYMAKQYCIAQYFDKRNFDIFDISQLDCQN